jgi:hypothetical protein
MAKRQILIADANNVRAAILIALIAGLSATSCTSLTREEPAFIPKDGFIPNEQVARDVAGTILSEVYGRQAIEQQKPLKVSLKNGVWHVEGTLPPAPKGHLAVGGVAKILIEKRKATVISAQHGE